MSIVESATTPPSTSSDRPAIDVGSIYRSPAFWPGLLLVVGVALIFWELWGQLLGLWLGRDGYYSHGFLVPFMSGYIVYRNWPRLKTLPVQAGWIAIIPLAALLYVARIASLNRIDGILALSLLATLCLSTWVIAGWRWMMALAPAILYLVFALPVWTSLINNYTNPLQIYSTKVAYYFLKILGFAPDYNAGSDPTIIYLNHFTLNVEVPCSGLKLLLALSAFTVFFILIARLRWWSNLMMLVLVLPLALFVNGIRIGLIGVVGELKSEEAGMTFHDYSGYLTLILCFLILFKVARWLGWKD